MNSHDKRTENAKQSLLSSHGKVCTRDEIYGKFTTWETKWETKWEGFIQVQNKSYVFKINKDKKQTLSTSGLNVASAFGFAVHNLFSMAHKP